MRAKQVIFALPPTGDTDFTMRIFNSDGSEPEMCGNGIRCLARFVADADKAPPRKYKIHTLAGPCQGHARTRANALIPCFGQRCQSIAVACQC